MRLHHSQLNSFELKDRLIQFLQEKSSFLYIFKGVYSKSNDKWLLLLGNITLVEDNTFKYVRSTHLQYPQYQFICKPIKYSNLIKFVEDIGMSFDLSQLNIPPINTQETYINWSEHVIPSHMHIGSFPIRRFSARVCSDVTCPDNKLIAYGMPFYVSAHVKIKDFLNLHHFHGVSDARKGELWIDIPDYRGRLTLSPNTASFDSHEKDYLSLVGAINGQQVSLLSPKDEHNFEIDKTPDIELWLVTKDSEVIDYYSISEGVLSKLDNEDTYRNQMLKIISSGESEHCEFKLYIDLTKSNDKTEELEKAVCAISNHEGGKLFIGVSDEAQIVGIDEKCTRDYKCDLEGALTNYQKNIEKHLKELLVKNQCFQTHLISFYNKSILLVDIFKVKKLNYLRLKNEAYVRRGASSVKMTPAEIQNFRSQQNVFYDEPSTYNSDSDWDL